MLPSFSQKYAHAPWLVYVLISSVFFTAVFVTMKVVSADVTPLLFAFLVNVMNVVVHGALLLADKARGRFKFHKMQRQTFWVAVLIGVFISSNDTMATYMFKANAPMSIAVPVFAAGNVFLTALFGVFVMREGVTRKKVFGLLCIIFGIVLLNV